MRVRKRWWILAAAVLAIVGLAAWGWRYIRSPEYQVARLLAEWRGDPPSAAERWLGKLGLISIRPDPWEGGRPASKLADIARKIAGCGEPAARVIFEEYRKGRIGGVEAVSLLADVGAPAVPVVIERLGDENPHVRHTAVRALAWGGTEVAPGFTRQTAEA